MRKLFIEPHYLPSLECFTLIGQADQIVWDIEAPFEKQTYRNRTYILGPNGVQSLIVPVHYSSQVPFREVTIDYKQSWVRDHQGAFYSSYGKAPYFEYFASYFQKVWDHPPETLLELNHEMLSVCLRLLQWQIDIVYDTKENDVFDIRGHIVPKIPYSRRNFFHPTPYAQNFGDNFVTNMGILDLLLCQGPASGEILKKAVQTPIERFNR